MQFRVSDPERDDDRVNLDYIYNNVCDIVVGVAYLIQPDKSEHGNNRQQGASAQESCFESSTRANPLRETTTRSIHYIDLILIAI